MIKFRYKTFEHNKVIIEGNILKETNQGRKEIFYHLVSIYILAENGADKMLWHFQRGQTYGSFWTLGWLSSGGIFQSGIYMCNKICHILQIPISSCYSKALTV